MKSGRKESHTKGLEFLNCATQLGRIVFDIEEEGVIRNDQIRKFGVRKFETTNQMTEISLSE